MTASTLTKRYIAAAMRDMPNAQREKFRRELTERIGDEMVAARGAGP